MHKGCFSFSSHPLVHLHFMENKGNIMPTMLDSTVAFCIIPLLFPDHFGDDLFVLVQDW